MLLILRLQTYGISRNFAAFYISDVFFWKMLLKMVFFWGEGRRAALQGGTKKIPVSWTGILRMENP
jgi:hypothetical protein